MDQKEGEDQPYKAIFYNSKIPDYVSALGGAVRNPDGVSPWTADQIPICVSPGTPVLFVPENVSPRLESVSVYIEKDRLMDFRLE